MQKLGVYKLFVKIFLKVLKRYLEILFSFWDFNFCESENQV